MTSRYACILVAAGAAFVLAAPARAQIGDEKGKQGVVQKSLVPRHLVPPAPARTPEEQLQTFQIAPGFRIELAASDPLVQDPVAMAIDPQGRLWVVEMRSYMPDIDGQGEDQPTGRVSVLEDRDGDGRYEKGTVFLDKLVLPRSVFPVAGGVLIGAPPKLWFCAVKEGDLKCRDPVEVATDYGTQTDPKRPFLANPEHAPNSPVMALDNWIYSAEYTVKLRYRDGQWERGRTTFKGQWGLSQDDFGRLYHNSNSTQLRADVVPAHYLERNPNYPRPPGTNVGVAESQFVWPIRVTPGINRGYLPEMLRDGKLKAFTAANGPHIYRGDLFPPEFYGNAFVCEPAAHLVKRDILIESNGSVIARDAYPRREFLASADERFRPVGLYTGPEGALYVVDLYRGVLQHRISVTSYLRHQVEERGLAQPLHRGRIWRIVPVGKRRPYVKPNLAAEKPSQWVAHLSSGNAWWRETAQRLLVERKDPSVVPALRQVVTSGAQPLGRVHALWTLEGVGQVDWPSIDAALAHRDPRVRVAAVRVSEALLQGPAKRDVVRRLLAMASDPAPQVQLQLALTLGEVRDPQADAAVITLATKYGAANKYLLPAAMTGLSGRELELLEGLLADKKKTSTWGPAGAAHLAVAGALARCVFAERKPDRVARLLSLVVELPRTSVDRQVSLLDGILVAAQATKRPLRFAKEPPVIQDLKKLAHQQVQARVAKLDHSIVWPDKPGLPPEVAITPLTPEEQRRFQQGKHWFGITCAPCHQPSGLGLEGLAPPLVESEWVLGSEQRLIRILLHGLSGSIKVKGVTYHLEMPGLGIFDDDQVAEVLTYVRREWEHNAPPIHPKTVKQIRALEANRTESWRQRDLLEIP